MVTMKTAPSGTVAVAVAAADGGGGNPAPKAKNRTILKTTPKPILSPHLKQPATPKRLATRLQRANRVTTKKVAPSVAVDALAVADAGPATAAKKRRQKAQNQLMPMP
jgi:hypothetical protein